MVLEKRCLPNHLLINTVGTKESTTLVKEIENDELVRRNTRLVPCEFVGDGLPTSKVPKKLVMVWNLLLHVGGWSGTDEKGKGKPCKGKGQDKKNTGNDKGKRKW